MAIKSAISKINNIENFEDVFKAKDITSDDMIKAIPEWYDLYFGNTNDKKLDASQNVPYVIIDGLYKAVFGEYKYSIDETKPNGKQLKTMLDNFDKIKAEVFQHVCIGGEILAKPIIKRDNFIFSVINRNHMAVFGRDAEKNITDLGTSDLTIKNTGKNPVYYRLFERRILNKYNNDDDNDNDGYCTIANKLYKSDNIKILGTLAPLNSIPEYLGLKEEFTLSLPTDSLALVPLRMPMVNCVDGSSDGVSIYAAAVDEIKKLYKHEIRSQKEYDLTEPHVITSSDIKRKDEDIPDWILSVLDDDVDKTGLTIWNPKPNQQELEARDDKIKQAIENLVGLRRGFLSKSDVQEFTATEILANTAKMSLLVSALQEMWNAFIHEAVRICYLLAQIYSLPGWVDAEPLEPVIEWGNGILYDEEKEFNRLNLMTAQGKLKDEYLLGWYFDMPTDTPEDLQAIRDKYMPVDSGEDDSKGDEV